MKNVLPQGGDSAAQSDAAAPAADAIATIGLRKVTEVARTAPICRNSPKYSTKPSPDEAKAAGVAVIATGRSDFPNQVNNATAFPGIFRGALDNGVTKITDDHKIAAAEVIASLVDSPTADEIIPNVFDERLVPAIAAVIQP